MKKEEFKVNEFKTLLSELQGHLQEAIRQDPEYQGEADDLIKVMERLQTELKEVKSDEDFTEEKYEELLPDMLLVLAFLNEIVAADEEGDEEWEDDEDDLDDDFDDFDEEEFEDDFDEEEFEDDEDFLEEESSESPFKPKR
jgi:hypothetical protein